MTDSPDTGLSDVGSGSHDLIPVPHAATVELGRDRDCPRKCNACAFNETPLQRLTPAEVLRSMDTLAKYWDDVNWTPGFQLIGAKFIEFLGIAGAMNSYAREDIGRFLAAAKRYNLQQIAFMCDAQMDERAIRDFYELHAASGMNGKGVIALSVDELPPKDLKQGRRMKSGASWKMLGKRDEYIKDPSRQNFRVFTTMSAKNLTDIPDIAEKVLAGGNLLFIAPLTAHTPEVLEKTQVRGRLLMGADTSELLTEEHEQWMRVVVEKLRDLKEKYPSQFLNGEANFENMLAACKPLTEVFRNNCRESCKFTLEGGEELNCTPNIRIVKKPGDKDLSLATCTCFVGLTGDGERYADTPLSYLEKAGLDPQKVIEMYRKLTRDLAETACPGCNCRTAIDIKKGGLK
jgi:hypothetical protein